jgi:hypothetical protein
VSITKQKEVEKVNTLIIIRITKNVFFSFIINK